MPLTPSQSLAAGSRGRPILVSAAAGSGKTRVLVERLMRYIDEGEDIDRFLVITYTRAAAAELKSRILRELNERIASEPDNRRLRRQTELVPRAGIGTIDSICGRLLREYVHLTALKADFRVIEEERAESMKEAALQRVLDEHYETLAQDDCFRALVDSVGAGRDDSKLEELVLSLCDSLRSHSEPEKWIESCRASLDVSGLRDASETVWGRYLLERCAERALFWAQRLREGCRLMAAVGHEKLSAAYTEGFSAAADALEALARCAERGWDEALKALPIPLKVKAFRGSDELKDRLKAVWDSCRKECERLTEELSSPSEEILADLAAEQPSLQALLTLTQELEDAYAADKRRAGVVDFSDQEHMVLQLLDREPTVRQELSERYREVMVDEYQDVNECQDRLFTALSGEGQRLFLVGDVKQSIYRFRLADPGIFLRHYDSFAAVEDSPGSAEPGRILLRENFRSSRSVIAATNFVFSNILSRTLGELDYDDAARLLHGRQELPDYEAPAAELFLLETPETEAGEEKENKTDLEAAAVAKKIRALLDGSTLIPDGDSLRPLRARDIAILLRSHKSSAPRYRAALAREGIAVNTEQSGGFFRSLEITVMLNFLSVIDNPRQDIPLISVLRSPLYAFSADELSAIRAADRDADFFTALKERAGDERCARFLAELEGYRVLAPELSVAELIDTIERQSELDALLSALPDGESRRSNLELLRLYALQFEQNGYKGLFRFVEWLKSLNAHGEEPKGASVVEGDAVQLMSIHRSKGLEFPVVFLCDTAHRFNLRDAQETVLIHPALGIGAQRIDSVRGVQYPTLAWRAIAACIRRESLSEEMRVLYVAMTRARERLFITGAWPDVQKKLSTLSSELTAPASPLLLERDNSMSLWLARCALLEDEALHLNVELMEKSGKAQNEEESTRSEAAPLLGIREALDWHYAYEGAENQPSKLTASGLKAGELPDEDADSALVPAEPKPRRSIDLSDAPRPLSGAERGTAVHLSLQFIDFRRCSSLPGIREELARLYALGQLSESQYNAIDPRTLLRFFLSPIGQRILHADAVHREQRFTLLYPASVLPGGYEEDEILFQGVVDCCIEEQGELTVIDYKTDYVTEETLRTRAQLYTPQVSAYADAMERIYGLPVREGILYFLGIGQAMQVYPQQNIEKE